MQTLGWVELLNFGLFGVGSSKMAVLAEFHQVHTTQFLNKNASNLANKHLITISTCKKICIEFFFKSRYYICILSCKSIDLVVIFGNQKRRLPSSDLRNSKRLQKQNIWNNSKKILHRTYSIPQIAMLVYISLLCLAF